MTCPQIKKVKPLGGGDFTLLQDWADYAAAQSDPCQWAECYEGGDLGEVSISGWVSPPTSLSYPRIYAAPTSEHRGDVSSGAFIVGNSLPAIYADEEHVHVEGLRIRMLNDLGESDPVEAVQYSKKGLVVERCLIQPDRKSVV